ncbi:hypothetical protein BpHYR1_027310 [Brachionus plicatilis]|uniref:Uncharacterized protein n=1 Tax=Brachionus plicatilis TaxID=10195 RepID=A0A3M7PSX8_BRAPC|nr:hypothetical protein BpHYR1_027310 [Brachionus plicatilis]
MYGFDVHKRNLKEKLEMLQKNCYPLEELILRLYKNFLSDLMFIPFVLVVPPDWIGFKLVLSTIKSTNFLGLACYVIMTISFFKSIFKVHQYHSETLFHHALQELKLHRVDYRLVSLGEKYVRRGLQKQVAPVCRLISEFRHYFESRDINYPTPLCSFYLTIGELFPLIQNI